MSDYLQLGPVSFQDFELPARIRFGGEQRLAVHVLPGGARVIDAMGRDDADIGWGGVFSGTDAADRARTIDLMRAQGGVSTLAWDAFCYLVVIGSFDASYEHSNWVPYKISCTVVKDLAQSSADAAPSVVTDVLADIAAVGALDTSAALAALGLAGALSPGTAAYAAAIGAVGSLVTQAQSGMGSAGSSLLAAQDPATAATAAGQLAGYADANGYAGRALANLDDLED
jgi:hypothetical protein